MKIREKTVHGAVALLAEIFRIARPACVILTRILYPAFLKAGIAGMHLSVQCDGLVHAVGTKNVHIGKGCRIGASTQFETQGQGRIVLGDNIRINRGCTIVSYAAVTIGDYAIIGEYVTIRDANHGMRRHEPMRIQEHICAPIHIGQDVWIGRGACVLPGVTIGQGAVIGANSVVTRDIPPFSIAVGAPACVIRERE